MATQPWLAVVGIGEEGIAGLTPIAQSLVEQAALVVGGRRHLALLPPGDRQERWSWQSPIEQSIAQLLTRRGEQVCVLASGDPLCYGIGATLLRSVPLAELTIIPAPSAFSLACARLGWALPEVTCLSLCGRDRAIVNAALYPQAKLLLLSADRHTPQQVATLLTEAGYGSSSLVVLEHMGGERERRLEGIAARWEASEVADLNTIAVTCVADAGVLGLSRLAGLLDAVYRHDGQLTKREVRAVTLAALAPVPGQRLWDVGAGCGSISIEWLRSDAPRARLQAVAIEQHPERLALIAHNAAALGVPHLQIVAGSAPTALCDLPPPDTIFIGGGLTVPDLVETCWRSLPGGGRLVANAVTIESEAVLLHWQRQWGGELTRIAIQRTAAIGSFQGWKPMAPVTQWVVTKPQ